MKHILIVEDEPTIAKAIRIALQDKEVTVRIAPNGEVAIELIEEKKPDLIVLDILIPGIDGYGVLEHLESNNMSIQTLILTNLCSEHDKKKCKEYGVCEYVVKSDISHHELWKKISKYLS